MNCHFCGKHKDEVSKLIQGDHAYICDGCIRLCYEIIQEEAIKINDYEIFTPREIYNHLEQYVNSRGYKDGSIQCSGFCWRFKCESIKG